jgi:hypothetical protein
MPAPERRTGFSLMPISLGVDTLLSVTDANGRSTRSETVAAGSDLHDRLRTANRNYQLQGLDRRRATAWPLVIHRDQRRAAPRGRLWAPY